MDGYELLGFLRSQELYRHTPVIMVTSRAGEKHREKALDLGASGYIVKPYQDDALISLIRELVSQPVPGSPARLLV
jgi:chemosensory pili system protein ChpA (sensor histidine kinase/response regulator)